MCTKEFGDKIYFLQNDVYGNFSCRVYTYAIIVHTRADQLLPKVWMEQFDTLPFMHEGAWIKKLFFLQNDSLTIFP